MTINEQLELNALVERALAAKQKLDIVNEQLRISKDRAFRSGVGEIFTIMATALADAAGEANKKGLRVAPMYLVNLGKSLLEIRKHYVYGSLCFCTDEFKANMKTALDAISKTEITDETK